MDAKGDFHFVARFKIARLVERGSFVVANPVVAQFAHDRRGDGDDSPVAVAGFLNAKSAVTEFVALFREQQKTFFPLRIVKANGWDTQAAAAFLNPRNALANVQSRHIRNDHRPVRPDVLHKVKFRRVGNFAGEKTVATIRRCRQQDIIIDRPIGTMQFDPESRLFQSSGQTFESNQKFSASLCARPNFNPPFGFKNTRGDCFPF